jgi:hypothetical protein
MDAPRASDCEIKKMTHHVPRLALGAVTAVGLVAVFAHLAGAWGTVPAAAPEEAVRRLSEELRRREDLERRGQAVKTCNECKGRVADLVVAGEMTLLEAAHEFGRLHEASGSSLAGLRVQYPGAGDDEVLCRHVITRVHSQLSRRPAERAAVRARLEEELQRYLDGAAVPTTPKRERQ